MMLIFRLALIGYTILLCYGLFRASAPPNPFQNSDKFEHLLSFTLLGLLLRLNMPKFPALWFWLVCLPLGPLMELMQHWVQPVREFSGYDALCNLSGLVLAMVMCLVIENSRFKTCISFLCNKS